MGHTAVVGGHTLISGEIKNILADETILDEKNKIMIQKLDPVIYDEEGMAYYHLGEKLLTPPYKAGTDLKKHLATLR